MFLDSELQAIQSAKERLSTRCGLRRQLVQLEVHSSWVAVRRKLSYTSLGLTLGLQLSELVLGYLRKRKGQGS